MIKATIPEIVAELARRQRRKGKIYELFPDEGPLRRELYPQHLEFFRKGKEASSRLALAANGVGKTIGMGGYEFSLHLTGLYPDWWPGYRFKKPPRFWIAGKTRQTTRDNQQAIMLGRPNLEEEGGGLIPADLIDMGSIRRWPGSGGLIESCRIKHAGGGWSFLGVRSYDQALDAWFGENLDGGWMDEPSELPYYAELFTRTRGSEHPCIALTFTPLKGTNSLITLFTDEQHESRRVINCTWDDVPHLTEKWKADKLANTAAYMRDTVSKGIPALGVGAVFPIPESQIICDPFDIPNHWPRIYGFDGGWHNTAAVWGAWNKDADIWYLYSEHKAGQMPIPVHAAAIKARGKWIPGLGDAYAANQTDGKAVIDEYRATGVILYKGDKSDKEARIEKMRIGLMTGKIKVFSTLQEWLREYRAYHYDDNGKLVKENDHLIDASLFISNDGHRYAKTQAMAQAPAHSTIKPVTFGRRI